MCFAPQRRALFRHLNFQKWSETASFCTLLTWKCASRHNGVQFFIAPVASWLRTRRFSEPTFRPSGATNHWKNTVFRDFPTFSRICIFCPLTLSLLIFSLLIFLFSLPLPCSAFHLSKLWEKERATCSHGHSQKREGTLIYCWPTPHALQTAGYPSISVNGPHGLRKRAIRKLEEHFNFTPSHDIRDFNIFQQPLPAAAGPHNLIIGEYGQVYRIGDDHN